MEKEKKKKGEKMRSRMKILKKMEKNPLSFKKKVKPYLAVFSFPAFFKNILKSIIFGIFKTDKGMGEGDSEGIWDAAMGEMTRWVLHMGRWISLERTSWKGDHRFGCL